MGHKQNVNCHVGTIKSFRESNNYGFIDCPEIFETYCRDVFLQRRQKREFKIGCKVRFTVVLNSKGDPQAKDLKSAGEVSKIIQIMHWPRE